MCALTILGSLFLVAAAQPTNLPAEVPIHLSVGQTSFDNVLTFTTARTVEGAVSVLLTNNSRHPIVIDSYDLSGSNTSRCAGSALRMAAYATDQICTLIPGGRHIPAPRTSASAKPSTVESPPTTDDAIGTPSLLLSLTWHSVTKRVQPEASAIPSPYTTPSPR